MWRCLITAAIVYGCGHPSFDGYRPKVMDRPLQSFYLEVNRAALDGHKVLTTLDDTRPVRYLLSYINRVDHQLRPGN